MLSELKVNYLVTKNSIAVICGDETRIYSAGTPEYERAKQFITDGDEVGLLKMVRVLKDFVATLPSYVGFSVKEDIVFVGDEAVPNYFGKRLKGFADAGAPYEYLLRFWENLKKNPSWRSVQTLYNFLETTNCPISKDGFIQCFKAVTHDFKDKHTNTIDNSPGTTVKMARNLISDDPNEGCHYGLHAGNHVYVKGFASDSDKVVEVLVNPAHVVCIPNDCSFGKMRVEEYTVVREVDKSSLVEPTNQVYDENIDEDEDYEDDYEGDEEFDEYA